MISVQKLSINLKVAIFMLMILEVCRMIKNIGSYKQSLEIEDKNLKKKKKKKTVLVYSVFGNMNLTLVRVLL